MKKTPLADLYLNLKAQMADLAEQEKAIKADLILLNDVEFEGQIGRVTISEVEGSVTYDKVMLEALVPKATLAQCKKQGKDSIRFNVKARLSLSKAA
jgi:hypothetical protein